jgi:membrane protein implicated in regulation of membrane protease activity
MADQLTEADSQDGRDDPENKSREAIRKTLRVRYFISLILAILFSFLIFSISRQELKADFLAWKPYDEFAARIKSGDSRGAADHDELTTMPRSRASDPVATFGGKLSAIDEKLHPAPDLLEAFLQICAVVSISFLWFFAFSLKGELKRLRIEGRYNRYHKLVAWIFVWWPVAASAVPVLLFIVTMHKAYQPAVFVMALAAILVAAEHYTGLKEQEHALEDTRDDLEKLVGRLGDQVRSIENKTEIILNDRGLAQFKRDVYAAYGDAEVIHAVVRIHDVDDEWWEGAFPLDDSWQAYRNHGRDHPQTTLLDLLTRQENKRLRADFISDFPLPDSAEWHRRREDAGDHLFGDLLGLAWEIEVLHLATSLSRGEVSLSAWVSRPLCWMHATDSKIFQVIQRIPKETSSVMTLADAKGGSGALAQPHAGLTADMLEWAHEDISQYVTRGGDAGEFVLSLITVAARRSNASTNENIMSDELRKPLNYLGMQTWIDHSRKLPGERNRSADQARSLAMYIFGGMLSRLLAGRLPKGQHAQFGDLSRGIL